MEQQLAKSVASILPGARNLHNSVNIPSPERSICDTPFSTSLSKEFDPIQSLLHQLQGKQVTQQEHHTRQGGFQSDLSNGFQANGSLPTSTSTVNSNEITCDTSSFHSVDMKLSADSKEGSCNPSTDFQSVSVSLALDQTSPVGDSFSMENHLQSEVNSNIVLEPDFVDERPNIDQESGSDQIKSQFQIPRSTEKREKNKKKAEEKRKAKSAKLSSEEGTYQYIPGMPGSVPPPTRETGALLDGGAESPVKEIADPRTTRHESKIGTSEAGQVQPSLSEANIRKEERLSKPAPWAKKSAVVERDVGSLSLQDIQKLEAEKERREKAARDAAEAEQREERRRREEEDRLKRSMKAGNWSAVLTPPSNQVKSLAEIQAEEAKSERERFDKESKERVKRSKDMAAVKANWNGKTNTTTSWAGKIAAASPAPQTKNRQSPVTKERVNVVAPDGFWEPVTSAAASKPAKKAANAVNPPAQQTKKKKKGAGENGACDMTKQFDDWCKTALEGLCAQVDIPTFLSFLRDIESPYEVHDYVKSYVGDGKPEKKFAVEYLEKRSQWKNAKRRGSKYEDDLTTPAHALSPSEGEFQEAGRKGKKKTKNSKSNLNHLLGFSIQGQGVNRGELDVPQ